MKRILLIILIIGLSWPPVVMAQTDLEGVLLRNHFTSDKWAQALNQVYINTSATFLELDQYDSTLYEDLTTYSEYEENEGAIDQVQVLNSSTAFFMTDLEFGAYLVYDFGADYFYNFTIDYDIYWLNEQPSSGINRHYVMGFGSVLGDSSDVTNANNFTVFRLNRHSTTNNQRWMVHWDDNGNNTNSGWTTDNTLKNSWLYMRMIKNSEVINVLCYNYPNRTSLRFSYNVTLSNQISYRYFYPILSYDLGLYPGTWLSGYIKDIMINNQTASYYFDSGNYYSINLLENATQGSIAYSFYGASVIPSGTSVELYLSDDNSTWTLWDNDAEFPEIIEAQNYQALYVWMRLNTTDPVLTPAVNFYHFFYESDTGHYGPMIILLILGLLIGIGIRRE